MVIIERGNVNGKVKGLSAFHCENLYNQLSYEPDDTYHLIKQNPKLQFADLRKRLFQRKRGNFPVGLLEDVTTYLDKNKVQYQINDLRKPEDQYNFYRVINDFPDLYPHQNKALLEIKARPSNAISIATGGGKTLVALKAIQHWGVNTLVIVPGLNLLHQFKTILEYHFGKNNVGTHEDKKLKPIVVANVQGLQKKREKFFNHFDAIIEDEAHHVSSDSHFKLNKKYWDHIAYRLFLSATLYRNDGADLKLKGLTGRIEYSYSAREAITDGFIVRPKFFIYKVKHYQGVSMGWHADYDACIANNRQRDKKIVRVVEKILSSSNKNILILANRIVHCSNLKEALKQATGVEPTVVTGETKNNAKAFENYRMGKIRCMIATSQVVGEGIDIPNVDVLVLAGGYTSPILINQSVGRVVRLDKERGKKYGVVIDFYDEGAGIMERHSETRMGIYKKYYFKEDIKVFK